ncbi:MAG: DUF6927 domain-containing protein [Bacillota bacterium]
MGWTFTQKYHGESVKAFFGRTFNYQRENGIYGKVLNCAVVNLSTAYIGYETNSCGKKEVIGVICLLCFKTRDPLYNFGYKDMEESMGPYQYDCPERILKLLTPTNDENALNWREKCRENIRKRKSQPRLTEGAVIEFAEPISFADGREEKMFQVVDPRRRIFKVRHQLYRISRRTLQYREWQIVGNV